MVHCCADEVLQTSGIYNIWFEYQGHWIKVKVKIIIINQINLC